MTTPGFFELYPSARPALPAGSYTAYIFYRPDAAVWANWTTSALSSFGAATIP